MNTTSNQEHTDEHGFVHIREWVIIPMPVRRFDNGVPVVEGYSIWHKNTDAREPNKIVRSIAIARTWCEFADMAYLIDCDATLGFEPLPRGMGAATRTFVELQTQGYSPRLFDCTNSVPFESYGRELTTQEIAQLILFVAKF